ncbi:hypothetical protein B0H63DRAFT_523897 [Podospora didyma]|uniref:Uncharacterized protein n=1 Tax=Podospora didyma TaxID=330526 RepID=A0AAE0NGM6_9PEZI|nr:hypothetical protein B0H63DRAFT_523897 [Podospora didyma]
MVGRAREQPSWLDAANPHDLWVSLPKLEHVAIIEHMTDALACEIFKAAMQAPMLKHLHLASAFHSRPPNGGNMTAVGWALGILDSAAVFQSLECFSLIPNAGIPVSLARRVLSLVLPERFTKLRLAIDNKGVASRSLRLDALDEAIYAISRLENLCRLELMVVSLDACAMPCAVLLVATLPAARLYDTFTGFLVSPRGYHSLEV